MKITRNLPKDVKFFRVLKSLFEEGFIVTIWFKNKQVRMVDQLFETEKQALDFMDWKFKNL